MRVNCFLYIAFATSLIIDLCFIAVLKEPVNRFPDILDECSTFIAEDVLNIIRGCPALNCPIQNPWT